MAFVFAGAVYTNPGLFFPATGDGKVADTGKAADKTADLALGTPPQPYNPESADAELGSLGVDDSMLDTGQPDDPTIEAPPPLGEVAMPGSLEDAGAAAGGVGLGRRGSTGSIP